MLPSDILNKRILISPLNWGMGHVSRCIPLIDLFLRNGNEVFVACDESQRAIFEDYFSELNFINHLGYPFKFGKQGNFGLDLARQFRQLNGRLSSEEKEVNQYVEEFEIDFIISDHRYGFKSTKVPSIFITHQLHLPVKWYEKWVQKIHLSFLKQFDEIWIPDNQNSDFSGSLSERIEGLKIQYIGIQSRFQLYELPLIKSIEKTIIVSGPDVYAERFALEQIKSERNSNQDCVMILPESIVLKEIPANFSIQLSTDWKECDRIILQSKKVVSRCGYSTLMDLGVLKVPFEITPTPGQREQEYLYDLRYKKSLGQARS
jgi:UDP:flavonoid glycosyltransferase YjiC (YdhE family)